MKLRRAWLCVGFFLLSSACTATQVKHTAPQSHETYSVLTNIKILIQSVVEKDNLIFETTHYRIVLAENQALPGRAIVRLKRACGDLACLTLEEEKEFFEIVRVYEAAVRNTLNATHFNWECLMNHAYRSKPWMPAVHWHATPRYAKPVHHVGKVFIDKDFGSRNKNLEVLLTFEERQRIIHELQDVIGKQ